MTPPEHITFFTATGMRKLVASCDLEVNLCQCFGSLIPAEMDRSIQRYFPKPLQVLAPLIRPCAHFAFRMMNRMKVGLEQEIYLTTAAQK
jgi:hypothetical protein